MKIVQKSLMHKGYIILKDGSFIPLWTKDLCNEAKDYNLEPSEVLGIFATNEEHLPILLREIKKYKETHGIISQTLTEELRTGFSFLREMKDEIPYYYK